MIVTLTKDGTLLWVSHTPAEARERRRREGSKRNPRRSLLRGARHFCVVADDSGGFRLVPL